MTCPKDFVVILSLKIFQIGRTPVVQVARRSCPTRCEFENDTLFMVNCTMIYTDVINASLSICMKELHSGLVGQFDGTEPWCWFLL